MHADKLGEGADRQTAQAAPSGSEQFCEQAKLIDSQASRLQLGIIEPRQLPGGASRAQAGTARNLVEID